MNYCRAEQAFQFFATVKDANTLHVNWEIAEGYYLYREKIQLELTNAAGVNNWGIIRYPEARPNTTKPLARLKFSTTNLALICRLFAQTVQRKRSPCRQTIRDALIVAFVIRR